MLSNRQIARIVYTAQRVVDEFDGMKRRYRDVCPRADWDNIDEATRETWETLVAEFLANPLTPEEQHAKWMESKDADGWAYGVTLDHEMKTHPCMMVWRGLTPELQAKDVLFCHIILGFMNQAAADPDQLAMRFNHETKTPTPDIGHG